MPTHHTLNPSSSTVHWGYWDSALDPVLRIQSGDTVTVTSISGGISRMPEDKSLVRAEHMEVVENLKPEIGQHILTGPIWVEGAEPGDTLEVRIQDIKLADSWGHNFIRVLSGALPEDFPYTRCIIIPINQEAQTAELPWGKTLKCNPFFGNFGVAPPPAYGRISSKEPREHGGNIDNKELTAGSGLLYLQTIGRTG